MAKTTLTNAQRRDRNLDRMLTWGRRVPKGVLKIAGKYYTGEQLVEVVEDMLRRNLAPEFANASDKMLMAILADVKVPFVGNLNFVSVPEPEPPPAVDAP